jgi:acyl carrier protein
MDHSNEIQKIIATSLNVPPARIHATSQASDLPEWDSLHHLLLVMEIEHRFGVKFALAEIANLDSVEKISGALEKRAATQ